MPANLLHSDAAIGVPFTDDLMDGVAVEVGSRGTGAGLEVVREARGGCEIALAERTRDAIGAVDTGVEVLSKLLASVFLKNGGLAIFKLLALSNFRLQSLHQ